MRTLLPMLLLLAGCGDPLSNGLFEEDALYSAALPLEEDVVTDHPRADGGDEARDVGDVALLPPLARAVSGETNAAALRYLGLVDWILAQPITTRERDRRTWGPIERAEGFGRLVVERSEDALFDYRVEASADGEAWSTLMEGEFLRGESLRDGQGVFTVHGDVLGVLLGSEGAGTMDVEHSRLGGGTSLRVLRTAWSLDGAEPRDVDYFFERSTEGAGVFEHRALADVVDGGLPETLATRAHWGRRGLGRADFRAVGGDLPTPVRGTECWDVELARTFWRLELPAGDETEGEEADCPFERQDPRELLGE